jgi:subtilisin family serine protease
MLSEFVEPPPDGNAVDWSGRIVAFILLGWIAVVALVPPAALWLAEQLLIATGSGLPGWAWSAMVAIQALFVFVPATLLASLWPRPGYSSRFRLWQWAAAFQFLGAAIQLPPPPALPLAWLLQVGVSLLFALFIWWRARQMPALRGRLPAAPATSLALTAALVAALPWLSSGALGSPLEAVANLAAALALGLAAALLLQTYLLRPLFAGRSTSLPLDTMLGAALVGSGALLLMGSGYGYRGQMVPLGLLLAAGALPALALSRARGNVLPLALLLGGIAAAPLLLLDPRELALALAWTLFALLAWAGRALLLSVGLALLVGLVLLAFRWLWRQREEPPAAARPLAALALLVSAGMALYVYLGTGNPGFYGERLFVVLHDQAELAALPAGDASARRGTVYASLVVHAETSQAGLRASLDRAGIAYTPYYLVNGIEVEGGPLLRLWLARRPDVERVLDSPTLRPAELAPATSPRREPPAEPPPNLTLIRASDVWSELGVRGAGIVVGQSDSGVQWDHPELRDSYRGGEGDHDYHWLDPWLDRRIPYDYSGHGTHTLGTVLGNNTGVAPDATWFACANLVRNLGNPALYLDCMQFMLAPYPLGGDPFAAGEPALGADVLNNSWGCPEEEGCDPAILQPAVHALREAGIFFVVSAGNEGPACGTVSAPPAIYEEVFSVGAVTLAGSVAEFSSRGPVVVDGSNRPKPDVMAPGVGILSAYPGDSYDTLMGTSMAGPHVAGVVALMWSANPALRGNVAATEQILAETAQPLPSVPPACNGSGGANNVAGYGLVDAYGAVEAALAWQP